MARTTVDAFLGRMRRQLHGGSHRLQTDILNEDLDTTETDVTLLVGSSAGIIPGATLSIGLELMRVTAWNSGTKTATVIRGWLDSEPAAHTTNAEVIINPRWSTLDIYDAMVDEINSWTELYRIVSDEFPIAGGIDTLELPASWANMMGIVVVRRKWNATYEASTAWPEIDARLYRGTTDWTQAAPTSGLMLRFKEPTAAGTVYVVAAMPFATSSPALADDLIADVGVSESMFDVLGMGVKLRVWSDHEIGRSSRHAQDDSRRAEETPVGATVQPWSLMAAQYRLRKAEELKRLQGMYPVRMS